MPALRRPRATTPRNPAPGTEPRHLPRDRRGHPQPLHRSGTPTPARGAAALGLTPETHQARGFLLRTCSPLHPRRRQPSAGDLPSSSRISSDDLSTKPTEHRNTLTPLISEGYLTSTLTDEGDSYLNASMGISQEA